LSERFDEPVLGRDQQDPHRLVPLNMSGHRSGYSRGKCNAARLQHSVTRNLPLRSDLTAETPRRDRRRLGRRR
jgi:hypothetical protein